MLRCNKFLHNIIIRTCYVLPAIGAGRHIIQYKKCTCIKTNLFSSYPCPFKFPSPTFEVQNVTNLTHLLQKYKNRLSTLTLIINEDKYHIILPNLMRIIWLLLWHLFFCFKPININTILYCWTYPTEYIIFKPVPT